MPAATQVSLPGLPALEVGAHTDSGRDPNKQVNEDAMMARETPHGHLAVVCDGMGGHVGGREASHLAIDMIFRTVDATPPGTPPQQVLRDALFQANAAIYARGQQSPELKGMGSTCVAVLTHAGGSDVAHVGDSRVYLLTQGQVYQVTKDHSLVQRLVDANMLTPEQAANHPNANQITNAFGQRPDVEVEVRPQPFPHVAGDTFVLCSDGLSDEVGPQDILAILAPHPPVDHAARQLVDLANARGGHDNITVILVRLAGGAPFAVPAPSITPTSAASTSTAEMEILRPEHIAQVQQQQITTTVAALPAAPPSAPQFTPPPPYTPTPIEEPAPRKSGKGVIVAVIIVLLFVVGGVAAAVILRSRAATEKTEKPPVESPSEEPTPTAKASAKEIKPTPVESEEPTDPSVKPRPRPSNGSPSSTSLEKDPPVPTIKPPVGKPAPTPSDWMKK
ncbi:MAG: protein phosphatase 2C domain-containing protein [Polyangiales bacterium]